MKIHQAITVAALGSLLTTHLFAQRDNRTGDGATAANAQSTSPASAQSNTGRMNDQRLAEHSAPTTLREKAAAYDRLAEREKLSLARSIGHDWSKIAEGERGAREGNLTVQEKAAAYDRMLADQKKADEKTR